MNTGQAQVAVIMWFVGILATAGLGLNGINMSANAGQDKEISNLNRETGELSTDIKYIKSSIDEIKELQLQQLKAQGITYKTNQSILPE